MAVSSTSFPVSGALSADSKSYLDKIDQANKLDSLKMNQDMGRDQFLHILLTQLANQNPLDPLQDKDFIAQMAQFSSLESMQSLNKNFETMMKSVDEMKTLMKGSTTTSTEQTSGQTKSLEALSKSVGLQTEALTKMNATLNDLKTLQIEQLNLLLSQAQAAAAYE